MERVTTLCRLDWRPPPPLIQLPTTMPGQRKPLGEICLVSRSQILSVPETTQSNLTSFIIHSFCFKHSLAAVSFQSNNGHNSTPLFSSSAIHPSIYPFDFILLSTLYITIAGEILSVTDLVCSLLSQFSYIFTFFMKCLDTYFPEAEFNFLILKSLNSSKLFQSFCKLLYLSKVNVQGNSRCILQQVLYVVFMSQLYENKQKYNQI